MDDISEVVFSREMLDSCRKKFGFAPRRFGFWEYFFGTWTSPPSWNFFGDDLFYFWLHQRRLLETGEIVWGHIVQANGLLYQSGFSHAPGEVIYCSDTDREVLPGELAQIAMRVYRLKRGRRENPAEKFIGDHLANEYTRVFGVAIPSSLSPDLPCTLSTIYIDRDHLPTRRLSISFFPLIVRRTEPHVAMILPARYWPEELKELWRQRTPKNWFVRTLFR